MNAAPLPPTSRPFDSSTGSSASSRTVSPPPSRLPSQRTSVPTMQRVVVEPVPARTQLPESTPRVPVPQPEQRIPVPQPEQRIPVPQPEQRIPVPQPEQRIPVPQPEQRIPVPQPEQRVPVPQLYFPSSSGGDDEYISPNRAREPSPRIQVPERPVNIATVKVRTPPPTVAAVSAAGGGPQRSAGPLSTPRVPVPQVVVVDDDDDAFKSEDDEPAVVLAAPPPSAPPSAPTAMQQGPSLISPASPSAVSSAPPAPLRSAPPASPPKPRPKKLADGTILQPEMDFTTEPFDVLLDKEDMHLAAMREARRAGGPKVLSAKTLLRLSQPRKHKPPQTGASAPAQRQDGDYSHSAPSPAAGERSQAPPQLTWTGGTGPAPHTLTLHGATPQGPEQDRPKGVLAALTWNNLSASERANETHFYICLFALGVQHHLAVDKRTTMCSLCEFVRLPVGGTLMFKGRPVSPFATAVTLGLVAGADHVATMRFTTHIEEDEQLARDGIVALQIVMFSNRIAYFHSLVTAQEPIPRHVFFDACDEFVDLSGDYWAYRKTWSPAIPYGPVNLVLQQYEGQTSSPQRSRAPSRSIFF
jgi:hypothetical protein